MHSLICFSIEHFLAICFVEIMKSLITGATGFLGQWLALQLLEEGHEVSLLVRNPSKLTESLKKAHHIHIGDISDPISLQKAFQKQDRVFHLAGLIAYKRSEREAMEQVNVVGTQNVVDACLSTGVSRLVHMSSVAAVGASFDGKELLNEDSPYNLHHLNLGYFETKRKAEELVIQACKEKTLDAVMLNPSNIYGAGDAEKGSRKTQIKVASGKFPFYPVGGCSVIRVEDAVQATIRASAVGRKGERYILAGENITIHDLFQKIARAGGAQPPKIKLTRFMALQLGALGDLMEKIGLKGPISSENAWTSTLYHWFDHSKAKKELDFKPLPADVAIENSVRWMKDKGLLT